MSLSSALTLNWATHFVLFSWSTSLRYCHNRNMWSHIACIIFGTHYFACNLMFLLYMCCFMYYTHCLPIRHLIMLSIQLYLVPRMPALNYSVCCQMWVEMVLLFLLLSVHVYIHGDIYPLRSKIRLLISNVSLLFVLLPLILPCLCMHQSTGTSIYVSNLLLACFTCNMISSLHNTSHLFVPCVTG
jgi:hypothetical protein